jgi:hypothetical protein
MDRSRPFRAVMTFPLGRYVPGMYVGTPRRNVLVTLTYLVVFLTLFSYLV